MRYENDQKVGRQGRHLNYAIELQRVEAWHAVFSFQGFI